MMNLRIEELSPATIHAVNQMLLKEGQEEFLAPVSYGLASAVADPETFGSVSYSKMIEWSRSLARTSTRKQCAGSSVQCFGGSMLKPMTKLEELDGSRYSIYLTRLIAEDSTT